MNQAPAQHAGYVTDVEYTGKFFGQQAPAMMNYIAAINGYAFPSLQEEFAYCELGCGKGITTIALAAIHPNGKFFACDINPDHIRYARGLAKEAGVGNVIFLECGIEQLLKASLPDFDFITLHGLWSWVSESVRSEIKVFLNTKLKRGGLAMISYNAMPGWAHILPIRQMMRAYADALPGSSTEKASQAYAYVRFLSDSRAEYFVTNPAATEQVKIVGDEDIRYVVHEYMTPHSDPSYFADVASSLHEAGLHFIGNMEPQHNYPALAIPERFQQLMRNGPSRTVLETHRDFIANTRFRNDLYVAQSDTSNSQRARNALGNVTFRIANVPERLSVKGDWSGVRFDFGPHLKKLGLVHALLGKTPATCNEIHYAIDSKIFEETLLLVQDLVLARHMGPCAPVTFARNAEKLNSLLIEEALRDKQGHVALVCQKAGCAEYFELSYALAIEELKKTSEAAVAAKEVFLRLREHEMSAKRRGPDGTMVAVPEEEELQGHMSVSRALRDLNSADFRYLRLLGLAA